MNKFFLIFLFSISLNAGAEEKEDNSGISTSALSPQIQPYISPKTAAPSKSGFLEENQIAFGTILKSRHFNKYDYHDYNEDHNGVYLNINRWSMGTFANSADERSLFVTYNPILYQNRMFLVNIVTGVANGYDGWENAQGDYMPILGFSAQWSVLKTVLTYDALTFGMEVLLN